MLFLLSLLIPSVFGCAPVVPGDNSTSTSGSKGTYSFTVNPPTSWTYGTQPPQFQSASPDESNEALQDYIQQQIHQAVRTVVNDRGINAPNISVTLDPHDLNLNNVTLGTTCTDADDADKFLQSSTSPPYVSKKCVASSDQTNPSLNPIPFIVEFTGKFDTGGLVLSHDVWQNIAVSMQNELSGEPYGAHFVSPLAINLTT